MSLPCSLDDEARRSGIIIRMPSRPPSTATIMTRVISMSKPEQHQGRHGHADAEGDRFAGRAGGLDDVVFENRRLAHAEGREKARNSVIDSTATGIEAETVMPRWARARCVRRLVDPECSIALW